MKWGYSITQWRTVTIWIVIMKFEVAEGERKAVGEVEPRLTSGSTNQRRERIPEIKKIASLDSGAHFVGGLFVIYENSGALSGTEPCS